MTAKKGKSREDNQESTLSAKGHEKNKWSKVSKG